MAKSLQAILRGANKFVNELDKLAEVKTKEVAEIDAKIAIFYKDKAEAEEDLVTAMAISNNFKKLLNK